MYIPPPAGNKRVYNPAGREERRIYWPPGGRPKGYISHRPVHEGGSAPHSSRRWRWPQKQNAESKTPRSQGGFCSPLLGPRKSWKGPKADPQAAGRVLIPTPPTFGRAESTNKTAPGSRGGFCSPLLRPSEGQNDKQPNPQVARRVLIPTPPTLGRAIHNSPGRVLLPTSHS